MRLFKSKSIYLWKHEVIQVKIGSDTPYKALISRRYPIAAVVIIIDELHREYFPSAQTCLFDCESSDGDDYSSDSEFEEMNENDIQERCQLYACQTNMIESKSKDVSVSDLEQIVREKVNDGCHCQMKCISNLSFEEILGHICCMKELSNEERDMYLMGKLKCSGTGDDSGKQIKRQRYHYYFNDREICKDAFLLIHDIREKYLKNLVRHMKTNGIRPRIHGNTGKKPHSALTHDDTQYVVSFIQRYAEEHGLPMPAAPRGRDSEPPTFLPCSLTKKDLHTMYSEACSTSDKRCVKLSSFYAIWSTCLPSIQIATPRSDVCSTCERHRYNIMYAHTEHEKLQVTRLFTEHLEKAEREHQHYIRSIQEARVEHQYFLLENNPYSSCSTEYVKAHYTFDFAQNVTVPHHSRQVGPLFFETPRKIQIFGICMEGSSTQYNYLLDEDKTIGKDGKNTHGPNTVLSILHHYFQEFGFGEKSAVLHCDNCGGQNKNRYTIGYLLWRVLVGLHWAIELNMQVPGHTKCQVDAGFAQIKKKYRRADFDTIEHVAEVVNKSSHGNKAVVVQDSNITYYNWKESVKNHFKAIQGIRKFHHFRFSALQPGVVFCKTDVDSQEVPIVLTDKDTPEDFPHEVLPGGLSRERQSYLFKHIRPYVRAEFRDVTCPPLRNEE